MFFDIGANIGNWSLKNINQCNTIIAVEASPTTFQQLKQNCNSRIIPLNYAVCNSSVDITFYQAHANTLSTMNKEWLTNPISRFYNEPYTEIICKTISIDKLIAQYGIPELIKIDVEGGEYECIQSLTQKVNLLCFEWASETNNITMKCLDYLFHLGYTQYFIQYSDNYLFRPHEFYDINIAKQLLMKTTPKQEWGMIWCK